MSTASVNLLFFLVATSGSFSGSQAPAKAGSLTTGEQGFSIRVLGAGILEESPVEPKPGQHALVLDVQITINKGAENVHIPMFLGEDGQIRVITESNYSYSLRSLREKNWNPGIWVVTKGVSIDGEGPAESELVVEYQFMFLLPVEEKASALAFLGLSPLKFPRGSDHEKESPSGAQHQ